jgi:alkanesulfonate monooxygenase SsuD/methylene tetrahydromethanopterin reductase-like flavin-dependent oxidoreductase (luciferase family)
MSELDDIQFYVIHQHHYTDIPADSDEIHSSWVDYPNARFDPVRGHELYARHNRELELIEELGFDAIAVNEHHNTPFSLQPAPSLRAAHLIARTERVKIMVAGTPLNLSMPNRVAEEYAMLDVMSGGRMEFGLPLGTGMEYWSNAAQINPTSARARFREGIEVLLQAWQADGPTSYEGEHFHYRFLNPWPRPYQRPHPKLYIVGSGSSETLDLALEFGTGYSVVFVPIAQQLKAFATLRERAAESGRVIAPEDIIMPAIVYVADSDEQAVAEGRPHVERFFSWFHRVPPKYLSPPGHASRESYLRLASSAALAESAHSSWEDMTTVGRIAVGSPESVATALAGWAQDAGSSRFLLTLTIADMPEEMAARNMDLFAREVIPRVRSLVAAPA